MRTKNTTHYIFVNKKREIQRNELEGIIISLSHSLIQQSRGTWTLNEPFSTDLHNADNTCSHGNCAQQSCQQL